MPPAPPLDRADLDHVVDKTAGFWDELRGMRLFMTGGTGFFGCWLLETFAWVNRRLNLDASATVLTRDPDAFKLKAPHLTADPAVTLHQGDVRSFEFPTGEFSHIIHAAADFSRALSVEQPLVMLDTVVQGTRRVLDFAVSCGIRRLLFVSSGAVYGPQPSNIARVPEDYPGAPDTMNPGSAYGEGKRAAELLCRLYAEEDGLQVKIARCFAFVGPHLPLDANFAVGNFIRDGLKGGPIRVEGDGTPFRSYLYAADLAIWLWTIMFRGETCHPYNVGSEGAITIKSLAAQVAGSFQPEPAVLIAKTATPGQPAERYIPSTKRATSELNLKQTIHLNEGIARTVAWQQQRTKNERTNAGGIDG